MSTYIPLAIKSLPNNIQKHLRQCYLANVLNKKEFLRHHDLDNISFVIMLREISERVHVGKPLAPEGKFDWPLVGILIKGVVIIIGYYNKHIFDIADKFIDQCESKIEKKKFAISLDEFSIDSIEHEEAELDPKYFFSSEKKDPHQIQDFFDETILIEDPGYFEPMTDKQLELSENFWKDLTDHTETISSQSNIPRTPKRRRLGASTSPPEVPSKMARTNIEHIYGEDDTNLPDVRPGDDEPPAAFDPSIPLAHPDDTEIDPNVTSPRLEPLPEIPDEDPTEKSDEKGEKKRRKNKPVEFTDRILKKNNANDAFRTRPIEDRRINPQKAHYEIANLFRRTEEIDYESELKFDKFIDDFQDLLRTAPLTELDETLTEYREIAEDLLKDDDIPQALLEETEIIDPVPAPPSDIHVEEPADPTTAIDPESAVLFPHDSPQRRSSFSSPYHGTFSPLHSRKKQLSDTSEDSISHLTESQFLELVISKNPPKMLVNDIYHQPPIKYDTVITLDEYSLSDWYAGLQHCMQLQMKAILRMEQARSCATLWLFVDAS